MGERTAPRTTFERIEPEERRADWLGSHADPANWREVRVNVPPHKPYHWLGITPQMDAEDARLAEQNLRELDALRAIARHRVELEWAVREHTGGHNGALRDQHRAQD